jgi:hypothetical protein
MFTRVGVVGYGASALRLLHALHALHAVNAEFGSDLRPIAVHRDWRQHAADPSRARLCQQRTDLRTMVRSERLGEVAAEFEAIDHIQRVRATGALQTIIRAAGLRPRLFAAAERGIARRT